MADWSEAPTILIFSDSDAGFAASRRAAEAHGGRVAAALPIVDAAARLRDQVAVDLVMLDLAVDHGPTLDALLTATAEGVAEARFTSVVTVSPQLVDIVTARLGLGDIPVLVGRDAATLSEAVAGCLRAPIAQLREPGAEESVQSPQEVMMEMRRIGRALASASGTGDIRVGRPARSSFSAPDGDESIAPEAIAIRELIRVRRLRDELFGTGLFADPAWDILLDLSAARIEGRQVAVSSLCIAAAVPATTALRWIKQLTESGLLRRAADPVDGRRVFIELTDRAAGLMTTYFSSLAHSWRV